MTTEHILLQLSDTLKRYKNILSRLAAILKVEEHNKTHLCLIYIYLSCNFFVSSKSLLYTQRKHLYDEINNIRFYEKLYKIRLNELVSLKDSSTWMKYDNIDLHVEVFIDISKIKIFFGEKMLYNASIAVKLKSRSIIWQQAVIECLAMIIREGIEVLRCIHLLLAKKYGFKNSKKLRIHSVEEVMENKELKFGSIQG
ncbi:hypothetical protein TCON_2721 [Astathelohania contejeani]|uniref:Uncharacterized protein n=1 Tax=Astathelohania contejeani TaxID=164912 RepID=A0ABQ7HV74_9MICR|nr:hypothetical protein TCON_2721 [Thelohania contejeani]